MKNIFLLILAVLVLGSCGPYQKAYSSDSIEEKLSMIDTLMRKEKYSKAVKLFEQVQPTLRGTDRAEKLGIQYGDAMYAERNYPGAFGQFERYATSYSGTDQVEYASFMTGKSLFQLTDTYSRDQETTDRSLAALQNYIDNYPEGKYVKEANDLVSELRYKLDKKAFEIAKNYHLREAYISAIKSFEVFLLDHAGSQFQDDAQFYLLDSQYTYAILSIGSLIPERLEKATEYYNTFANRYPESEYKEKADKIKKKIDDYNNSVTP